MMKVVEMTQYGSTDSAVLLDREKPIPSEGEVLVKVEATGLNMADVHMLNGFGRLDGYGLFSPKHLRPGADIAGQVAFVGKDVGQFENGDRVFGDLSSVGFGGLAEYVCVPAGALVHMPENITFEEAAALPMASMTALQALRNVGNVKPEQKVLINGASGGVGNAAIQLAKYFGAHVTAICSSQKQTQAIALGADEVYDYTHVDFTKLDEKFDLILGVNGNRSVVEYKRALSPRGTCVVIGGSWAQIFGTMLLGPIHSSSNGKQIKTILSKPNADDLAFVAGLVEGGHLKPLIDKVYDMNEVSQALSYLKEGHAKGKVILGIGNNDVHISDLQNEASSMAQ